MNDIDLLVKEQDLGSVDSELINRGYEPGELNRTIGQDNYEFQYTRHETKTMVEIHWTLFPPSHRFHVPAEEIWAKALHSTLANVPVLVLPPQDLLVYLCLHAVKDLYNNASVRMLCDIAQVIKCYGADLDWAEMREEILRRGICRPTFLFLRLTRDLLHAAIPEAWLSSIQPSDFANSYRELAQEQIFSRRRAVDGGLLPSPNLGRIWDAKGVGDKAALIRDRLTLDRKTMSLSTAAPSDSWRIYLSYFGRVRRLLQSYGPAMWKLVRGDSNAKSAAFHTSQMLALNDWLLSE